MNATTVTYAAPLLEERVLTVSNYPPLADDHLWKFGRLTRQAPIPMTSFKNVSPTRVKDRRRRKKAAKKSQRRNRK